MLISPAYRALNVEMHADPDFGTSGHLFGEMVRTLVSGDPAIKTALDYGCGKGTLAKSVTGPEWREYDPAVPGKDAPPVMADLVCCTEVLEHVEPECVEAVLDDLARLSGRWCFITVENTSALKRLPDGRNAHLTVRPWDWWKERLERRFRLVQYEPNPSRTGMMVLGIPLRKGKRSGLSS